MDVSGRRERHRFPIPGPTPWLVIPHGNGMTDQIFCTVSSSSSSSSIKYTHKSIPELCSRSIWGCFHGWLLLVDEKNRNLMFLCNPISLETIKLPSINLKPEEGIKFSIFTSSPKDPICSVLLFHDDRPVIKYCRPCDQQWTEHAYSGEVKGTTDNVEGKYIIFKQVSGFKGLVYATTKSRHMFVIKVDDQNYISIQSLEILLPRHEAPLMISRTRLVESYDELFAVIFSFRDYTIEEVGHIQVFKLDFSQKVWHKLTSLMDRSLFLGDDCSTSSFASKSGIEGNQIYFTIGEDKDLYSFNLEEGSISVSLTCPKLSEPWFSPMWVMPDLRLIDNQVEGNQTINQEEKENGDGEREGEEEEEAHTKSEVDHEEQYWSDLPLEIYTLITEFLNLFEYMNFRATCRLFRLAAPLVKWRTRPMRLDKQCSSPCLVFLKNKNNDILNVLDAHCHDTYFLNMPELLLGTSIWGSKDGFLLMTRNAQYLFFFNPFMGTTGEFPLASQLLTHFSGITFSSPTTSSDCLVVGISQEVGGILVSFIHVGAENWSCREFECDFIPNDNSPIFLHGSFYFLGRKGNLGVFRLEQNDESSWEVIDELKVPCNSFLHNFLAEWNGDLLSVFVVRVGEWVKVFRLDHSEMVWVEVKSLGNHTLYVSILSSFTAIAIFPRMENKIYFSRLVGQSIVSYSMETRKFHSTRSNDSIDDFYNTREYLNCGWIQPSGF